jgi:hypothetical protein
VAKVSRRNRGETLATANLQRVENTLAPRPPDFEETVRILRVAVLFGETDPPQKKPAAGISRGGLGLT